MSAKLLMLPLRMHPEWGDAAAAEGQPPVVAILGIDPAFRTGCKLALVDMHGQVLNTSTVYPHPLKHGTVSSYQAEEASAGLHELLVQGLGASNEDVSSAGGRLVCSIGNGTASRETEAWLRSEIKAMERTNHLAMSVAYVIVDEAGASVYSASPLAGRELSELDVSMRGAVSIARRLIDPLAELVKIDPQSIGVGLYQHDVDQKRLAQELKASVEDCVNSVGVDLNTASPSLLEHVAGLSGNIAQSIVKQRESEGPFRNRSVLRKVSGIGKKVYHQAVGFLRIFGGDDELDATSIHPESYQAVADLRKRCGSKFQRLDEVISAAGNKQALAAEVGLSGAETLEDIVASLTGAAPDPRAAQQPPRLKIPAAKTTCDGAIDAQEVGLSADALKPGMHLQGVVRNVVAFGAFVDIGVGTDGLVHSSAFCNAERPKVNDRIEVWVQSASCMNGGARGKPKWRIGLSMKAIGGHAVWES